MTASVHAPAEEAPSLLPSMNREQTLAFLRDHGIPSLGLVFARTDELKKHVPVLYVFQDSLTIGVFKIDNPTRKPSLARIDNPVEMHGDNLIAEGQVDYYAVDPETKEIFLVKTGWKREYSSVGAPYLFEACDELFPKGAPRASR